MGFPYLSWTSLALWAFLWFRLRFCPPAVAFDLIKKILGRALRRIAFFRGHCYHNFVHRSVSSRSLIIAVLAWAALVLPWRAMAAAAVHSGECHHCLQAAPGIASEHSCCPAGAPCSDTTCGQSGLSFCQCSFDNSAFITPSISDLPAWEGTAHALSSAIMPVKLLSPHIFHPPENTRTA